MVVRSNNRRAPCVEEAHEAEPVLGKILAHARRRHNFTLREVERRTGIPNAHLSQIERGQIRKPDQTIVLKLARLLDLDFGLLASWIGPEEQRSDERAAYFNAAVRFLRDLNEHDLAEATHYLEKVSRRTEEQRMSESMDRRQPRLGLGHSTDGASAAEVASEPVARTPK